MIFTAYTRFAIVAFMLLKFENELDKVKSVRNHLTMANKLKAVKNRNLSFKLFVVSTWAKNVFKFHFEDTYEDI